MMSRADPLFCCVQYFELELVHNEWYDDLQDHQHDNKETDEIHSNQPTGSDFWGKPLLIII